MLLFVTAFNNKDIGSNAIKCLNLAVTMLGLFFIMEIWKDILGYEGIYQVSSFGCIRSFKKNKLCILKQTPNTRGYLRVSLYDKNCKHKSSVTHVLMAMTFLNHKPDGTQKIVVDHINNNKLDNRLDNLQLISARENSSKDKKGITGAYLIKGYNKWRSTIHFKGNTIHLGVFNSEKESNEAYKVAINQLNLGLDLKSLYPKWKNKTSQYKGVCLNKTNNKWMAYVNKKNLGYFKTEMEAYNATIQSMG